MIVKETIAVVGLQSGKFTGFVKKLANDNFRLLIVPENKEQMEEVQSEVKLLTFKTEIEIIPCAKDCCWEADVIAILNPHNLDKYIIERIRAVAVQKVVMAVFERVSANNSSKQFELLDAALPHSKVVKLTIFPDEKTVSILTKDKETEQEVTNLLKKSSYTIIQ